MFKVRERANIFNDGIAKVEYWDFSRSNMDWQSRILAITTVASICYQNPKGIGKESLYNRLAAESAGLPSSAFEFVPVLIKQDFTPNSVYKLLAELINDELVIPNVLKYGKFVTDVDESGVKTNYLLTNYRALFNDYEKLKVLASNGNITLRVPVDSILEYFNTEHEAAIIRKYIRTFKAKIDIATRSQLVRHRTASYQELSRRYVSDSKIPFEFYIAGEMEGIEEYVYPSEMPFNTKELINANVAHYQKALENGVKPQKARGIIPQCAYTEIWVSMMDTDYNHFIKMRTDEHAQWEIRQLANAMLDMTNYGYL